jgi:hypothetical protein
MQTEMNFMRMRALMTMQDTADAAHVKAKEQLGWTFTC